MNKVFLIGRLARDPELRKTSGGISVCNFTLAVDRPRSQDGTRTADFLAIQTWRGLADNCAKFLAKGRKVAVEGRIQVRSWDAQDGSKRYATEIVAENVEFLTPRESTPTVAEEAATASEDYTEVEDNELPF